MTDSICPICRNPDDVREQTGCAFINPERAGCPYFDRDNKPKGVLVKDAGTFNGSSIDAIVRTVPREPEPDLSKRPTAQLLYDIQFAMEMDRWHWNSDASKRRTEFRRSNPGAT